MGSGVLLAALVVLWFVVLVPMVVTRGDASAVGSTGADAGRMLQRRRTVDPAVFAETERVAIDRAALLTSGELRVDVHAVRRRTLAGLLGLTLVALVGALTWSPWLWIAQGVLDLVVVAYLVVLRAAAAGWQDSAVVGLDDDDIGFADIDVSQPRRVANG